MGNQPSPIFGGLTPQSLVHWAEYVAHRSGSLVLPAADTPAWTRIAAGAPTEAVAYAIYSLTASEGNVARYYMTNDDMANDIGTVVELRVKIDSSSSEADTGLLIEVRDGEAQFVAWLRADGVNMNEEDNVPFDMTDWHIVTLSAHGTDAILAIDGEVVQFGHLTALVSDQRVGFGCADGYGYAVANIDWCIARPYYGWATYADEGWIMTISGSGTIANLPADPDGESWCTLIVDHSDDAEFTLAEPPVFGDSEGAAFEPQGLHVELLCDTDGDGFTVKLTNYTYTESYGYPAIPYTWSRTGYVEI